jgi:hypothetical protein
MKRQATDPALCLFSQLFSAKGRTEKRCQPNQAQESRISAKGKCTPKKLMNLACLLTFRGEVSVFPALGRRHQPKAASRAEGRQNRANGQAEKTKTKKVTPVQFSQKRPNLKK